MAKFVLDNVDKEILRIIQETGDISNIDLAAKVGLAPSSCLLRVKNLKEYGFIKKTITLVDAEIIGYKIVAFLKIDLKYLDKASIDGFSKAIKDIPQIIECYMTTGNGAFLVKVIAKDLKDYHEFVLDKLVALPVIANVETSIVINTEKYTSVIPIV